MTKFKVGDKIKLVRAKYGCPPHKCKGCPVFKDKPLMIVRFKKPDRLDSEDQNKRNLGVILWEYRSLFLSLNAGRREDNLTFEGIPDHCNIAEDDCELDKESNWRQKLC